MKKLIIVFIIIISSTSVSAKVSDSNLSIWYGTCKDAGNSHKLCKCHVKVMNEKLSNYEFEKLMNQRWKIADWMFENVIPFCGT